jgi:hypothetical protein
MFLFLSYFGWVIYFCIKLFFSYFVGLVAMPIGFVKMILAFVSTSRKERNIKENLSGNLEGASTV